MGIVSASEVLACVRDFVDKVKQEAVNGVDITVNSVFTYGTRLVIDFDNSRRQNPDLVR